MVVLDTTDYVREATRQLSDANYNVQKDQNLTEHYSEKIKGTLQDLVAME